MADAAATSHPSANDPQVRSAVLLGTAIVLAVFTWVFLDFGVRQVRFAMDQTADWGHTLIIPGIAGLFVWQKRQEILDAGLRTTWIGFVPIVGGIGWYMICVFGPQVLHHHNLRAAGVGAALFGIVLLFCGWRAMRWLLFPIAYVVLFSQTISDRFLLIITERLQDITAIGAEAMLQISAVDVTREGNTLYVADSQGVERPLNIAEACSGMRMLMAFMALGTAMAYTGLGRWWQRIVLVGLGIPIAIFVNILRVLTLGYLSLIDSGLAAGDFHALIGLIWLMPAFLLFLGAMWVVRKLVVEPEEELAT